MGQRDLARTRARSAAHDRRRGCAVMRRAKRRHGHERTSRRQEARDRVDARHLQRLRSRRAAGGFPAAGARASSCPFPAGPSAGGCASRRPRSRAHGARAPVRARPRDPAARGSSASLRQRLERRGVDLVRGSTRRPRRGCGRERARCPRAQPRAPTRPRTRARADRHAARLRRRRASPRPGESARRAELADRGVVGEPLGRKLPRRTEHGKRDRKVESRSFLANAAGARLTVIRRLRGHSSEAETTPLRTRCFASWHARSARPTIAKPGIPG